MTKFVRLVTAAAVAAATFTAAPALAATGATTPATARAQVVKPLTLVAKTNLDFGTILLTSVAVGTTYTVILTSAGALSCTTGLTCSSTGIPATFNVAGSNNQKVFIYTAASNFTNGITTLQITPSAAAFTTLTNSGAPGTDFNVGASFPITSATTEGVYTGNLTVTVDYN
ncbi:MAG: DUF4402 domain-containing protein [Sphingomicrobium sp.]